MAEDGAQALQEAEAQLALRRLGIEAWVAQSRLAVVPAQAATAAREGRGAPQRGRRTEPAQPGRRAQNYPPPNAAPQGGPRDEAPQRGPRQGAVARGRERVAPGTRGQLVLCRPDAGSRVLVACALPGPPSEGQERLLRDLALALAWASGAKQSASGEGGKADADGGQRGSHAKNGGSDRGSGQPMLVPRPAEDPEQIRRLIARAGGAVDAAALLYLGPDLPGLAEALGERGGVLLAGPELDELAADPAAKRALWERMRALGLAA